MKIIIEYDWKESLNWTEFQKELTKVLALGQGFSIKEVETNGDSNAVVLGTAEMTEQEAQIFYNENN
jgi:hypothetical protein